MRSLGARSLFVIDLYQADPIYNDYHWKGAQETSQISYKYGKMIKYKKSCSSLKFTIHEILDSTVFISNRMEVIIRRIHYFLARILA